ncbi:restriction endonuclease subunit S [Aeromonas veronii]|uniref:Restriction endonuclease subunit S n=1 Tax=Aeromonas veronii TaxID=654 RepID=A0A4V3Z0A8_AERVE|nr:restriction endonuclease subunit S [Aeromonas veronii]
MKIENLITDHLDLWTAAVRPKSSAGRGSNSKLELTGIKKLRELILELAVRGKLVPQDPSDEPASVLLERIAAEKARLVKEKKIKKEKPLPAISEDEKPFELPKGWEWCRFEDIVDIQSGITKGRKLTNRVLTTVPYLSVANVQRGYVDVTGIKSVELPVDEVEKYQVLTGDLLITEGGDWDKVGRTAIWADEMPYVAHQNHVFKARTFLQEQDESWLEMFLNGPSARDYFAGSSKQTTNLASINKTQLRGCLIAIPPKNEKSYIVAKVDELMTLCDQLEQYSESQLAAHQTLVETLLATLTDSGDAEELSQNWARLSTHFDTLFTTETSIDALKQTILQLAVMGKLVPQDPSDEPAIDLLNRLVSKRDEWLKKESKENSEAMTMLRKLKKLTVPTAPFELPKAWACAHLIQLSQMLVDCHNKTAPYVEVGIPIIRTTNIRERQFIDRDLKFVSKETYDYWSRRCPPEPGDIIFTREAPMGEALIIPAGETWCLGQRTMLIRPMHEFVSNKFLLLALTEPHLLERASEHAVGLTVKHLRVGDVENLSIPLPPLAEQHRIVAKVDELMALCDQLTSRLQTSQQTQLALAESLVEGALA